jgi:hypothetical protein
MRLTELETEVHEQQSDAADIALEVENHRQQAEALETAVHALLEAKLSVDSEGVRRALDHASEAKYSTRQRLEELRAQRKDLLERNRDLQGRCVFVLEKKRQALEKMPHLLWGQGGTVPPGDPGFSHYSMFAEMLEETIHRTGSAWETLKGIHKHLEALEI